MRACNPKDSKVRMVKVLTQGSVRHTHSACSNNSSINSSLLKILSVLDTARLDEYFDHTGVDGGFGVGAWSRSWLGVRRRSLSTIPNYGKNCPCSPVQLSRPNLCYMIGLNFPKVMLMSF